MSDNLRILKRLLADARLAQDHETTKEVGEAIALERRREMPHTPGRYSATIALAADSVDQLRISDVFRVIEAASDGRFLDGFAEWLRTQRPELGVEITECMAEIRPLGLN